MPLKWAYGHLDWEYINQFTIWVIENKNISLFEFVKIILVCSYQKD